MSDKIISNVDENTYLITSEEVERKLFEQAVYDYNNKNNLRSVYFNESGNLINFKIEDIDKLAFNAQSSLNDILKINTIIRYFVNKDGILGKVYEAIETNVNSDSMLIHPEYSEDEKDIFDTVDKLIKDFNKKINLKKLTTTTIPMTYLEGTYILYLRKGKNGSYEVDSYPLGIVEISDYNEGGEPYVLLNVSELESRLRKTYRKTKKNKALFYENMTQEIKDIHPIEVYDAHINKESYAKLNIKNTGVMRINNLDRKYGLSPIFKALKSAIRLDSIELTDDQNTMARGKKIIFQKLSKELFLDDKKIKNIVWSEAQALAHVDLMNSLKQKGISVYTGLPWTEDVKYVEPTIEQTNVQVKKNYRDQILSSVGISYLSADKGSFGAAQISINELLKLINKIAEQLEDILYKWYQGILIDHGIDVKYCPTIKVLDSEKLSIELQMQLAKMLNMELNASWDTVYSVLGLDAKTEIKKRREEKELGYDEVLVPRITAYTNSGKSKDSDNVGRPSDSNDIDKQDTDRDYNRENNR